MTVIRLATHVVEQRRTAERLDGARDGSVQDSAEERQLVRSAANGSREAWTALVARHAPTVWARAVEWTDSEDVAAQVSEVVWLRLAQSLLDLHGTAVGEWLYYQVADEAGRRQRLGRSLANERMRLTAQE